jgi:hypothetical protein
MAGAQPAVVSNPTTGAIIPISSNFLAPTGTGYLACSDSLEETITYRFEL